MEIEIRTVIASVEGKLNGKGKEGNFQGDRNALYPEVLVHRYKHLSKLIEVNT